MFHSSSPPCSIVSSRFVRSLSVPQPVRLPVGTQIDRGEPGAMRPAPGMVGDRGMGLLGLLLGARESPAGVTSRTLHSYSTGHPRRKSFQTPPRCFLAKCWRYRDNAFEPRLRVKPLQSLFSVKQTLLEKAQKVLPPVDARRSSVACRIGSCCSLFKLVKVTCYFWYLDVQEA